MPTVAARTLPGLLLIALAGCQQVSIDNQAAVRGSSQGSSTAEASSAVTFPIPSSAAVEKDGFPQWAFPGPFLKSIPGGKSKYSDVQLYDRTQAVDWDPASHPTMPDSVKGRPAQYACGFCHLPQGAGRSENAALAGLPAKYIIEQVHDFKSGARQIPDRKFGAGVNMEITAKQASEEDIASAAKYFASLKYSKHLNLIESNDVPRFAINAFVYTIDKNGPREPLGDRIIEGPDNFELFEMRDPNMTFTAYVPTGSVARGAALAKGDGGARPACETCHGPGLKGTEIGPPIAGRLPTGLFRQLFAFKTGKRNGQNAQLMKPMVEPLSNKQLIDLASYVSSLQP